MDQITPQQQAENIIEGVNNTYQVIAKRHVHHWYSWALMASAIGFTVGVAYVANQGGQFDASQAAIPDTRSAIVVNLSRQLPIGTAIYPIKFNSAAAKPELEWVDESHYRGVLISSAERRLELNPLDQSQYGFDSDDFFDPGAPIGVVAETPAGDLFVSGPAVGGSINFDPASPYGNIKKQSAHYRITASFLDSNGKKTAKKFRATTLSDWGWTWGYDYGAKVVDGAIVMNVPGPQPVSGELFLSLGPDPEDPEFELEYGGKVFLPNYGGGTYEVVFADAYSEDATYPVPSYASAAGSGEVTQVIFTPTKGGRSVSSTKPRPKPSYLYGGGALELTSVTPKAATNPKNKLRRIASFTLSNRAAEQAVVRGIGITISLDKPGLGQLFPSLSAADITKKVKLSMEAAAANKKPKSTYPYGCGTIRSNHIDCLFWFDVKTVVPKNKSKTFTLDFDPVGLPAEVTVTASIAKQEDVVYEYGKTKSRYYLGPQQVPLQFTPITF